MKTELSQLNPQISNQSRLRSLVIGIGFTTLYSQILLIREAGVWLRGNEFIVAVIVAAWLMWTATGCIIGSYLASDKNPAKWIYPAWLGSIVISIVELILLRCFWTYTGNIPGETINLGSATLLAVAATALPCMFSGFAVGSAITCVNISKNRTVAYIYFLETIGGLTAGVVSTFVFIPLQHWWFTLAVLITVPVLQYSFTRPLHYSRRILIFLFVFIFLASAWRSNLFFELFAQNTASKFLTGKIVLNIDTPRERFTVTTRENESAFYINGRLIGSSVQHESAEEISWYSFLSAEKARTVLYIGFPYNGILREFLQKNLKVTVPDPQKYLLKEFASFLANEDLHALTSQSVYIVPADCRTFLRSQANHTFDIIVENIGIPESYSLSRLYSKEWFSYVANQLNSNGTLTVVLPGSAGYVPDDLARIVSRIFKTMKSVFNFVTIIPSGNTMLIASNTKKVTASPEIWLKKWRENSAATRWFNQGLIEDNLNEFRIAQFTNACAHFSKLPIHTDSVPLLYGDSLLYSEARFSGLTHRVLSLIYNHSFAVMIYFSAAMLLFVILIYTSAITNSTRFHIWLLMTTFSSIGFIGEMMLLVRFVISRGSLFYSLGLLFAGFMFGLAAAAYTIEKMNKMFTSKVFLKKLLMPVAVITLSVSLWIITYSKWPSQPYLVLIISTALNTVCGLCVGTCFAILAWKIHAIRHGGITLYFADLCGAMAGGLLFSIIIPPALGFSFLTASIIVMLIIILPVLIIRS